VKLNDLDGVIALRNHRAKALALRSAAACRPITCVVGYSGDKLDPFSVISADPVRDAIVEACNEFIAETEGKLAALGVVVPAEKDAKP